jgi:hypothetical protein
MIDPRCTHRIFNPVTEKLEPVTPEQYQAGRSNPNREPKDRSNDFPVALRIRKEKAESQLSQDRSMRQFLLKETERVKVAGYNRGKHAATTGTSVVGRLVATDGMGFCIAVAIGGEKINPETGKAEPGGKIRIFHIYPHNDEFADDIEAYVKKLKSENLTAKAAICGGNEYDTTLPKAIHGVFVKLEVPIEFDERGSLEDPGTPLGGFVGEDNRVHFVTEILVPEKNERSSLDFQWPGAEYGGSLQQDGQAGSAGAVRASERSGRTRCLVVQARQYAQEASQFA